MSAGWSRMRPLTRDLDVEKSLELCTLDKYGPLAVCYDQPGLLSSSYFKSDKSLSQPLQPGWVDIETRAIGLNIKVNS